MNEIFKSIKKNKYQFLMFCILLLIGGCMAMFVISSASDYFEPHYTYLSDCTLEVANFVNYKNDNPSYSYSVNSNGDSPVVYVTVDDSSGRFPTKECNFSKLETDNGIDQLYYKNKPAIDEVFTANNSANKLSALRDEIAKKDLTQKDQLAQSEGEVADLTGDKSFLNDKTARDFDLHTFATQYDQENTVLNGYKNLKSTLSAPDTRKLIDKVEHETGAQNDKEFVLYDLIQFLIVLAFAVLLFVVSKLVRRNIGDFIRPLSFGVFFFSLLVLIGIAADILQHFY